MAQDSSPSKGSDLYSVARLDTASKLSAKFDQIKAGRSKLDQQWRLNLAFYGGKQYSFIDRLGRVQTLSTNDGDKPRHLVRLVSNQIMTGSQSLLSKYTKTKPVISATPGSASDHDLKAAQMAEDLMEYWWHDLHLEDALEEAILWGIIAGQGYWKITWDEHAGKAMRFLLGPDGKPIVDDAMATSFRSQLETMGIEPQEQVVYLGDIKVEVLSPFNVYLDPSAKTFKDAKYAICVHFLDPDEIRARWNKDLTPDAVALDSDAALPFNDVGSTLNKTVKAIYTGYFLPSAAMPNGRYVVWTTSPNEILQDERWPYPSNELPLIKFPGVRVPGRIYDSSVVEHAIPLQKELNKTISQIVEYKNLTIKPRVWAPTGSLRQRITNEAGAVYEFTPIAGLKPEIERLPTMPPYVFEHLKSIGEGLKDMFNLTAVTEGQVPPNVEAGVAIDLLQEMSTDRLAPTIKMIESALQRGGQQMLVLAQKYYIEPRLLKIRGSGGSVQVRRFTQADIQGGVSVHVEAGSGLPRTRAGRQARIQSYVEMGILKPEQAWKYLDIADLKSVAKMFQADEDMAYREHDKLIKGVPINPQAVQQAMMTVAQGINPQTQLPFQSMQEAIQYVQDAALEPLPFENWTVHLDTHGLFLKSVEYESLQPDQQQRFVTHYQKTFEMGRSMAPMPPSESIKTSLRLQGTVGPTAAAEIISKSVPGVTPEQMAEPPLDTIVQAFDPQINANGSPELAQQQQQGVAIDNVAKQQDMAHKEEQHQQALQHKQELHQAKLAQAKKGPPRRG